ncbi:hypothetical protein KIPB_010231 [Kipferlia bialata]|uniref:Vps53 N-terminal domain-containing protein n=1 Tax=Kipferlia bialata TaxID=797122 RepID=A0A9K3GM72_9EUKA|nr:hypothetical protein KIPB_010231 [Kipferlia bialata]|eukprot:g10231.t1
MGIAPAESAMTSLFTKLSQIGAQASAAEQKVGVLCSGIRGLDTAKTNIGTTVSTLQRMHSLSEAVSQLAQALTHNRLAEAASLLTHANILTSSFEAFGRVPAISELRHHVSALSSQARSAVEDVFSQLRPGARPMNSGVFDPPPSFVHAVRDACELADALNCGSEMLGRVLELDLVPYESEYQGTGLEVYDDRCEWLLAHLSAHEDGMRKVFPKRWGAVSRLIRKWGGATEAQLAPLLPGIAQDGELIALLLRAVVSATDMEAHLSRRYGSDEAPPVDEEVAEAVYGSDGARAAADRLKAMVERRDREKQGITEAMEREAEREAERERERIEAERESFESLLVGVFVPYLAVFSDRQGLALASIVTGAPAADKGTQVEGDAMAAINLGLGILERAMSRGTLPDAALVPDIGAVVLPSCHQVLLQAGKSLKRIARLSAGPPLGVYASHLRKTLSDYAEYVADTIGKYSSEEAVPDLCHYGDGDLILFPATRTPSSFEPPIEARFLLAHTSLSYLLANVPVLERNLVAASSGDSGDLSLDPCMQVISKCLTSVRRSHAAGIVSLVLSALQPAFKGMNRTEAVVDGGEYAGDVAGMVASRIRRFRTVTTAEGAKLLQDAVVSASPAAIGGALLRVTKATPEGLMQLVADSDIVRSGLLTVPSRTGVEGGRGLTAMEAGFVRLRNTLKVATQDAGSIARLFLLVFVEDPALTVGQQSGDVEGSKQCNGPNMELGSEPQGDEESDGYTEGVATHEPGHADTDDSTLPDWMYAIARIRLGRKEAEACAKAVRECLGLVSCVSGEADSDTAGESIGNRIRRKLL